MHAPHDALHDALCDARNALRGLGMVDGLAAEQVDEHLARYHRLDDIGRRGLAFYLCEVEERRLYQVYGFNGTVEYARHRHELSARRTRELLHAGARLRELVLVDEAFCRQEITWSKVILLLRVATAEHESAWLERAMSLGIQELKREVRLARQGGPPRDADDVKGLPEVRFPVKASLGVVPHEMLETAQKKLTVERGRPATVEEVLELALGLYLDLECKGEAPGWTRAEASHFRIHLHPAGPSDDAPLLVRKDDGLYPIDGGERDGPVASQRSACACCDGEHVADDAEPIDVPTPPALRRRVLARDHHRCRCCGSRAQLHVHHILLRSEGGRTKAYNLITLCMRCHALVHAGLLVIRGRTTKKARFVDRDGRPIHGPDRSLRKERLLRMEAPPGRPLVAGPGGGSAAPGGPLEERVTLADVPDVVDAGWLRRHAGLIRCSGERGLALRPGRPEPDDPPTCDPASTVQPEEAFRGLVGRDDLLARLETERAGAQALGEPFPHTLLTGPAGSGKTTLATGVAACAGARLVRTNGPLVRDVAVLLRLLASLEEGDVLFVDEVHAVPPTVLEVLYQAMAEGRLSLTFHAHGTLHEHGGGAVGLREKAVELHLPAFTLLAATTAPARLDGAFVSRFGVREHLAPLGEEALARLARRSAWPRGFEVTAEAGALLAARARGTPRELLRLVDRAVRFAAARGTRLLDEALVVQVLGHLGYDAEGLDPVEQRCVALLRSSRDPIPERRLAALLGVDRGTLTEAIEPWLVRREMIRITRHGRVPGPLRRGPAEGQTREFRPSAGRRNSAARLTLVGASGA